ncbi:Fimbrial-type adhesion domain-containing protein [Cupriavidus oxalaticus]|uniref:fimbrial protein n=1 Tax=Cupriavidus oxalaticus TaxID=96344 RepID=UPI003F733324
MLWGMCLSLPAVAACVFTTGNTLGTATLSLPVKVNVPRNAPAGTILYDSNWVTAGPTTVSCAGTGEFQLTRGYATPMQVAPGYTNVYQTTVQGIGVKVAWINWLQGGSINDALLASPPLSETAWSTTMPYGPMGQFRAQLIVTGPVATGVITLPSPLAQASYGSLIVNQLVIAGSTQIVAPACSVQNPSVAVRLPTVSAASMSSVGSTAGQTAFHLSLNCSGDTAVAMTITDATQPGNAGSNLALGSDSTASGVAFQILYNNTPVRFGADSAASGNPNQFAVGNSGGVGGMQIPLAVRYIRIGTVTPGVANGYATFTMSYQ